MTGWKLFVVGMALALACASSAFAEEYVGGMGTNWIGSAMTLPSGAADITLHGQIWAGSMTGYSGIKTGGSAVNFNFGYSRNFELGISQITYMDPNWGGNIHNLNGNGGLNEAQSLGDSYIIPGDLSFRLKYGNMATTIGEVYILHSIQFAMRYRVAKYGNLPLYPYFGGGNAPSLTWNASWYDRPLYPDESKFFGFTMTFIAHNDETNFTKSAQSVQYGAAYMYPLHSMMVGIQAHGMFFVKTPRPQVYSREPFAYISPVVNFKLYEGIDMMLSPEILLNKTKESTDPATFPLGAHPDNYEPWRFSGLLRYRPSTTFYSSDPFAKVGQGRRGAGAAALRERLSRESKESLFDWTVDSERDLQFLNLDLQKTINERRNAETELEQLKKEIKK